jgi:hypothetical protein
MVDVFVEQVQTTGVAEGLDLFEQAQHRNAGLGGATGTQVVAVTIDQAGPVLRRAAQPIRLRHAGITFHGIQRKSQPP